MLNTIFRGYAWCNFKLKIEPFKATCDGESRPMAVMVAILTMAVMEREGVSANTFVNWAVFINVPYPAPQLEKSDITGWKI